MGYSSFSLHYSIAAGSLRIALAGKGFAQAAVNGQHRPGRPGASVGGEEQRRLRDILGKDRRFQQIALPDALLELFDGDALRSGPLRLQLRRPQARLEDGVRVQEVTSDAVSAVLDRQDARQLRLCRLRAGVGSEVRAGGGNVLRDVEHQAAA